MKTKLQLLLVTLGLAALSAAAQVPGIISHQGKVTVNGTNYTGAGAFKFALVDATGANTYWSNDGTSSGGAEPTGAVTLATARGVFSVNLGDTNVANMTQTIPASVFTNSGVYLRVWFNDGTDGSQLLSPDRQITSVGYALVAASAGSVAAANIAGTIGVAQLPAAVLTNGASGVSISGTFSGDGAGVTNVNLQYVNANGAIAWTTNSGFALTSTLTVGSLPINVVAADVNGDGKLDLICANMGDNTLTVLTNNGSGGFGSNATLTVGNGPVFVCAADVNGDGKLDLICANNGASTLTVLTNNGSGGFVFAATLTVGDHPSSVVAADVNGDGKLDLISANIGASTLTVLTNNGSGGFVFAATLTVGNTPFSVVAADVNGDGKLDLISANAFDGTLTVLTNDGSGGFSVNATLTVGNGPYSVVAADVNGDGKVDLISANMNDGTLTVLTNNGSGVFGSNATLTVGSGPFGVVAADVNGDGKLDLICANMGANTLTVLTNNGSGGFSVNATLTVGNGPYSVVAADVNGDGKLDLICANNGANTLSVLLNASVAAHFTGDGSGLNNLTVNAANLTGQIGHAQLPANMLTNGSGASGTASIALGQSTTASGENSTAMGYYTTASDYGSTALGSGTTASGGYSTAMGVGTTASGQGSTAMGSGTTASGLSSTALGNNTTASGENSTAMGYNTSATNKASTALGESTTASGFVSTAMGESTTASGYGSTAMGSGTTASGQFSTALGQSTTASGGDSTALGFNSTASGHASTALGNNAQATNDYSFVWADGIGGFFTSTANSEFSVRAGGGVRFVTGGAGLTVDGQPVLTNGASMTGSFTGNGSGLTNLTLPTASSSQAGALSGSDWITFNNKTPTNRTISTTAPLTGGGSLAGNLTLALPVATSSANGYLASGDWTTFNNKANSGANGNITSLTGLTTPLSVAQGGSGQSSFTAGQIHYGSFSTSSSLFWDSVNSRLGIGTTTPGSVLEVKSSSAPQIGINTSSSTDYRAQLHLGNLSGNHYWEIGTDLGMNGGDNFYIADMFANKYRMEIDTNGSTLFGPSPTEDPTANRVNGLEITADGRIHQRMYSTGNHGNEVGIDAVSGADFYFYSDNGSRVIDGNIYTTAGVTSYNTTSDRRLKENIAPTRFGLTDLMNIEIVDYNFISDAAKTVKTGVIAQDLQPVYPDAVTVGGDDAQAQPWSVDYGKLTPLLVKSVQELKAENDALKAQNAAILQRLVALEAKLGK